MTQTMYAGIANSPSTTLDGAIDASVTTISVVDASKLPSGPNIAVIGTDETAETILYTAISTNDLTGVTRGFQGTAKSWSSGESISRNFTAYDHDTFRANIEDLVNEWPNHFTTANVTYYVNASTGSDSTGDGSVGAPFATIQHAIDLIPQIVNHTMSIRLAAGTYTESVVIKGFVGQGTIDIRGNAASDLVATPDYIISGPMEIMYNSCSVYMAGISFSSAGASTADVFIKGCIRCEIRYCMAVASESTKIGFRIDSSLVYMLGNQVSNHNYALYATIACVVASNTWTAGSGNTTGIRAEYGATVGKNSTQPQGTTAETVAYGGEIR